MNRPQKIKAGDLVELEPTIRLIERYDDSGPVATFYGEPMPAIIVDVQTFSGESLGTTFEEYTFLIGENIFTYEHIDNRRLPFRKI
jgi:hypothetical protein